MGKHKTSLIKAGAEDEEDMHPLQRPSIRSTVGRGLDRALNNIQFGIEEWIEETRAIGQSAAVAGDFDSSFKFYESLGKAVGAIQDPKAQHLHVHTPISQVQEMSTEELHERRAMLTKQRDAEDAKALEIQKNAAQGTAEPLTTSLDDLLN